MIDYTQLYIINMNETRLNYQLCYVKEPWAYFAIDYKDAGGDDWDDAPYEHNASTPYYDDITKVAYDIYDFTAPSEGHTSSPYSVNDINAGAVAWLYSRNHEISIYAGTTLKDFIRVFKSCEDKIYVEYE